MSCDEIHLTVCWKIRWNGRCSVMFQVAVFREAMASVKAPYVPEPQPVDSERHVGMIYCQTWLDKMRKAPMAPEKRSR